jgi:ABC-type multidrug transport system ATPase subunit
VEVGPGECLGIAGRNAAGKSTLLMALSGWLPLAGGEVRCLGRSLRPGGVPPEVGVAAQDPVFFPRMSARQNLRFFGRLYDLREGELEDRVVELVHLFELEQWADQPAASYSGGIARRLHLAMALINRPRVLLLDEPTVGLDPPARRQLLDVIGRLLSGGVGVVMASQILADLEVVAGRLLVIEAGSVAAAGTTEELLAGLGPGEILIELVKQGHSAPRLEGVAGVLGWQLDGNQLRVRAANPGATLPGILASLAAHGVSAARVEIRPPAIDQLVARPAERQTPAQAQAT